MQVEARYDNATREFVVIVRWADGRQETERFATAEACRVWLIRLEDSLAAQHWVPKGSPQILPHGWPDDPGRWHL